MSCLRVASGSRGQASVETAVSISLYMLVVLGLIEGGLVVNALGTLAFAVHDGARFAVLPSTPNASAVKSRVATTASDMGITIAPAAVTVAVNGTATDAAFTGRSTGDRLRVTATYSHRPVTLWIYLGAITFSPRTEMVVE